MMYEPGDYVCPTDLPRRFLCQVVGAESFDVDSGQAQILKLKPLEGPWPEGTCLIRVDRSVTPAPTRNVSRRRGLVRPPCRRAAESAAACDHLGVGFDDLVPEVSGREALQAEPALDGVRVLLVDDDADIRDAIATVLAACGAQVVAVGCGADALQALKNQAPNVLVSDMAMPGMDGRSLLRRIRRLGARRGSIPAIALTAYASPVDRMQALLAGYQVFLPKPFDPTELITLVAKLAGPTPNS